MSTGDIIKALREKHNLTQTELAKYLEVSPSIIGMYEQGRRRPSFEMLEAIADYFNVSVEYLLYGDPSVGIKKDPIPKDGAVGSAKQKLLDALDGLSDSQIEKLIGIIEEAKKLL